MNTKGGNAPVILIDSIYRKYEIILSFLEKYYFIEDIELFL